MLFVFFIVLFFVIKPQCTNTTSECEGTKKGSECCKQLCDSYTSWFQRDKCWCDNFQSISVDTCEVYCKYPYIDLKKCTDYINEQNDDLRIRLSCNYLGKECAAYCLWEKEDEDLDETQRKQRNECNCIFKYEDCENYCNYFPANSFAQWNCQSEYLLGSCGHHDENFTYNECQCKNFETNCEGAAAEIKGEQDIAASRCYYLNDTSACEQYCGGLSDADAIDYCLCSYVNNKESCLRTCDGRYDQAADILACKCEYGSCSQYCETYFTDDWDIQRCKCEHQYGNFTFDTDECEIYCENVRKSENANEKELAKSLCENYCNDVSVLHITVIAGNDLPLTDDNDKDYGGRDYDYRGGIDAFVRIKWGEQEQQSQVLMNVSGSKPFNFSFEFKWVPDDILIELRDDNTQEKAGYIGDSYKNISRYTIRSNEIPVGTVLIPLLDINAWDSVNAKPADKPMPFFLFNPEGRGYYYCGSPGLIVNFNLSDRDCRCSIVQDASSCGQHCEDHIKVNNNDDDKKKADDLEKCNMYCDSLNDPKDITRCRCDYDLSPFLCRDYCTPKSGSIDITRCTHFCNSLGSSSNIDLCKCNFNLDLSSCTNYCNSLTPDSAKFKCLCDLGRDESACLSYCEALGTEVSTVRQLECLCHQQINTSACVDYCNVAFVDHPNATLMKSRCKCDYKRGDKYCVTYSKKLEAQEGLKFLCEVVKDKQACYNYCENVATLGNQTETSKCWCEIYGDTAQCPVYCDLLSTSHSDFTRCKCLYFQDVPSCVKYCSTVAEGTPEHDNCVCNLVPTAHLNQAVQAQAQHNARTRRYLSSSPSSKTLAKTYDEQTCEEIPESSRTLSAAAEISEGQRLHDQACARYCRNRPSFVERAQCACDHGLDDERCPQVCGFHKGASYSRMDMCRCELEKGSEQSTACRNYCSDLYHEANDREKEKQRRAAAEAAGTLETDLLPLWESGMTPMEEYLQCMCKVNYRMGACTDFCNSKYPESNPLHAQCLCEYTKDKVACGDMCEKLPTTVNATDAQIISAFSTANECRCKTSNMQRNRCAGVINITEECGAYCDASYGLKGELPYESCYIQYDPPKYSDFCNKFREPVMKDLCTCFYDSQSNTSVSESCKTYCLHIQGEGEEAAAMARMCSCFWGKDKSACNVFCEPKYYADYLCSSGCGTLSDAEEQECLCNAHLSSAACERTCNTKYLSSWTQNGTYDYWTCRCLNKIDLLSCWYHCKHLPPDSNETENYCLYTRVYLGAGNIMKKGRYTDEFDFPDYDTTYHVKSLLPDIPDEIPYIPPDGTDPDNPIYPTNPTDPNKANKAKKSNTTMIFIIAGAAGGGVLLLVVVGIVVVVVYRRRKGLGDKSDTILQEMQPQNEYPQYPQSCESTSYPPAPPTGDDAGYYENNGY